MKTLHYTITFLGFWAVGSGKGGGLGSDSLVLKVNGLPIIPGKTLKGLFREIYAEIDHANEESLFGHVNADNKETENKKGCLYFGTARLAPVLEIELLKDKKLIRELYHHRSTTAIEENKQAKENSLRKMQICVPLSLSGTIDNIPDEIVLEKLILSLKGIRHIGEKRNRGLGRCKCEVSKPVKIWKK